MKREDISYIFTYNVAFIRKENNLSKNKMAQILGIGIKSLNKLEKGTVPPRLSTDIVYRIEERFDISAKKIVGKEINLVYTM